MGFLPLVSSPLNSCYHGLVVVGQALQGWDAAETPARWTATEASTPEGRAHLLEQA